MIRESQAEGQEPERGISPKSEWQSYDSQTKKEESPSKAPESTAETDKTMEVTKGAKMLAATSANAGATSYQAAVQTKNWASRTQPEHPS